MLRVARQAGLYQLTRRSRWRSRRLLIIGYHGLSRFDEHLWNPGLYITPERFEARLTAIRKGGFNVLKLNDAVSLLASDELPSNSVVMTFDDGFNDFHTLAEPLLKRYEIPATLYLTTFHARFQSPVFDPMCSYLLWKGSSQAFDATSFTEAGGTRDISTDTQRILVAQEIRRYALRQKLDAAEKDALLARMANVLKIDYQELVAKRMFHIMSQKELEELDRDLIDIELHTHTHKVPLDKSTFFQEIDRNRSHITSLRRPPQGHFCYPSGIVDPKFTEWLKELGVLSATTCFHGLAEPSNDPFMLPRFFDTMNVSDVEFEGWLTGIANFIPRRRYIAPEPTEDGNVI